MKKNMVKIEILRSASGKYFEVYLDGNRSNEVEEQEIIRAVGYEYLESNIKSN